jgi:hypothetical protein
MEPSAVDLPMARLRNLRKRLAFKTSGSSKTTGVASGETVSSEHTTTNKLEQPHMLSQTRIVELTRELGGLQEELARQRAGKEVLMRLLPLTKIHCEGLLSAVRGGSEAMLRVNERWHAGI